MRTRGTVLVCLAIVLTLSIAVSPAAEQERIDVASPTGDRSNDQSIVMVNYEDVPPWARRGAAKRESTLTGYHCRPVLTITGEATLRDPGCVFQGESYYWCLDRPVMGTFNGTYYYYSRPEWNGWELEVPLDAMDPNWWMGASYLLAVFDTNKGQVFAQESEVWHAESLDWWAANYAITGGTGQYEGATGFMSWAGTFFDGVIRGEICTPSKE